MKFWRSDKNKTKPTKCLRDFHDLSKQQLNTNNKQNATNGNLVGNPIFYQGRNPMLSKLVCLAVGSMHKTLLWLPEC